MFSVNVNIFFKLCYIRNDKTTSWAYSKGPDRLTRRFEGRVGLSGSPTWLNWALQQGQVAFCGREPSRLQ